MEQLPGLLIYFCVAVIVPIALARFGVRADWRTIRNTCLIWYGFLVLAFGGPWSSEAVGWAMIFTMFFSIPAVPIIALLLKGWGILGRSSTAAASGGIDRRWWRRFPVSLMSPAQWLLVALLGAGAFFGAYWSEQRDLNARAEVPRSFLSLPAGIRLDSIQSLKSPAAAPRIAAIVRFTKPEFEAFAAQIDNASLWQEGPPSYDGAPVEVILPEKFRWHDLPLPIHAGNRFVNWTKLSSAEIRSLKRGRVLCIALQRKPLSNRSAKSNDVPRYTATDCSEFAKSDRVAAVVVSALDLDTKTLHMIIN